MCCAPETQMLTHIIDHSRTVESNFRICAVVKKLME
jgi:hypothetical protein